MRCARARHPRRASTPTRCVTSRDTVCPFELERWRAAVEPQLHAPEARIDGRSSAQRFSAQAMAERVAAPGGMRWSDPASGRGSMNRL